MEFEEIRPFLQRHHRGVITTYQANGAAHASVLVCGAYQGNAAFVIVRGTSVKARNLRRDPRCTVLAVTADWRSWATVEGEATLYDYANTDAEVMRTMLRDVFRACGDKDHPDWEEYDRAMRQQDAVIVLVRPQRVYGQLRE
jgi:PPOX class probable F420-dependent enzyme